MSERGIGWLVVTSGRRRPDRHASARRGGSSRRHYARGCPAFCDPAATDLRTRTTYSSISGNALSRTGLPPPGRAAGCTLQASDCILVPPMAIGDRDLWVFRIVHQDTGKPAPGVPVTVLDKAGNAAGHWVSDGDGIVAVPRRETTKLRLRLGLRSEDPLELATSTLGDEPTPLAAPTQLPPTHGAAGEHPVLERQVTQPPPAAEAPEVPGHVLYFQRLALFAERTVASVLPARDTAVDFFSPPSDGPAAMRYGALIEVEAYWQSPGVHWGEPLSPRTPTPRE